MQATLILIDQDNLNELIDRACERAVQIANDRLGGKVSERWLTAKEAMTELGYKSMTSFYAMKPKKVLTSTNRNGRILYSLRSIHQYREDNQL